VHLRAICGALLVAALVLAGSSGAGSSRAPHNRVLPRISGAALINTEDPLLDDPTALAMLIDVFSERGFHAVVDVHRIEVPESVDLTTGAIKCRIKKVYRIQIRFQGSEIRRG